MDIFILFLLGVILGFLLCFFSNYPFGKKAKASLYVLVIVLLFLMFLFYYYNFGFTYMFWASSLVSLLLISIFITDIKYMIILDTPLVLSGVLIIILKFVYFGFEALLSGVIGGILLFLLIYIFYKVTSYIFKRPTLGFGDIKLCFIIGLFLGFGLGLCSLCLAVFLALPYTVYSLFNDREKLVAFGPFLASSLFVVFLFQDKFQLLLSFLF